MTSSKNALVINSNSDFISKLNSVPWNPDDTRQHGFETFEDFDPSDPHNPMKYANHQTGTPEVESSIAEDFSDTVSEKSLTSSNSIISVSKHFPSTENHRIIAQSTVMKSSVIQVPITNKKIDFKGFQKFFVVESSGITLKTLF